MAALRSVLARPATLLAALCLPIAAATQEPAVQKIYTQEQAGKLMTCIALGDQAMSMAGAKVKGMSREEMLAHIKIDRASEGGRMLTALADEVWSTDTSYAWDFMMGFFRKCAVKVAKIDPDKVEPAAGCMYTQEIAAVALGYRYKAARIEAARQHFAKAWDVPDERTRRIVLEMIDTGYNWTGTPSGLMDHVGGWCIAQYTS